MDTVAKRPTLFRFLKWFGPAVCAAAITLVGVIIGIAQTGAAGEAWAKGIYDTWLPVMTTGWFLACVLLLVVGYVGALVYSGKPQSNGSLKIGAKLRVHHREGELPEIECELSNFSGTEIEVLSHRVAQQTGGMRSSNNIERNLVLPEQPLVLRPFSLELKRGEYLTIECAFRELEGEQMFTQKFRFFIRKSYKRGKRILPDHVSRNEGCDWLNEEQLEIDDLLARPVGTVMSLVPRHRDDGSLNDHRIVSADKSILFNMTDRIITFETQLRGNIKSKTAHMAEGDWDVAMVMAGWDMNGHKMKLMVNNQFIEETQVYRDVSVGVTR